MTEVSQRPPVGSAAPGGSLRPGSVVPLEPVARPGRAGRWWGVALAVAVLLGVGVLTAVVVRRYAGPAVAATGRPEQQPGLAVPSPSGAPEATPTTPLPPQPAPPSAAPPIAPAGYQIQHAAEGYWVAIPKGWTADQARPNGRQWWGDLSRSDVKLLFVTIKVKRVKPQSATAALTGLEVAEKHSSNIFYHRVRLAGQPRIPGTTSVADLEFTDRDYAQGAQTWHYHTLVRAVVTPDNRLYTIELMILHDIYNDAGTTEGDWQLAVPTAERILGSFRLG